MHLGPPGCRARCVPGRRGAPGAPGPARDSIAPVVACGVYVDGRRQDVAPDEALTVARERGGFVWLGLYEPSEAELTAIGVLYGLHPLAVEDAVYAHQRPKLERYDEGLFMVLKTARYAEHDELTATSQVVITGEIMVFLGCDYLITVRHGSHSALGRLRRDLEQQPDLL